MASSLILDIPEVAGLDARGHLVRIAPELDAPLTPRVRRLIDTAAFRRLGRISQLGLVSLVYPAARHTRFEHSLGVYRLALSFLRRLAHDPRFCQAVGPPDAEAFIAAALLHDLGHWPFCHAIEDMGLPGVPLHEHLAARFVEQEEVAAALREDWGLNPKDVAALLLEESPAASSGQGVLTSMLSGPIDIDKMDYLARDSLHAGVPYGRNFDAGRLIGGLCLNAAGDGLAITDKGKTAAEMMVFSRYVMFSEVYWHHGVRAATAMLQRAIFLLHDRLDYPVLFESGEEAFISRLLEDAEEQPAYALLDGLFGPRRRLYKRLAQYSYFEQPEIYARLARRPYAQLAATAERFADFAAAELGLPIAPHEVLIDAPPVEREVEFHVDVYFPKHDCYRPLGEISPVVRTLAREQFDDYVKRVRLFCHPRVAEELRQVKDLDALLLRAVGDG